MANALTGDYNAVVQVRIETINRILAAMHQNGLTKDATPSLPAQRDHAGGRHLQDPAARALRGLCATADQRHRRRYRRPNAGPVAGSAPPDRGGRQRAR